MTNCIEHEYHTPDGPITYEYSLREKKLNPAHAQQLSNWTRQFVGMPADEVMSRLQAEWGGASKEVECLVSFLTSLTPTSIAIQPRHDYSYRESGPFSWLVLRGVGSELALLTGPPSNATELLANFPADMVPGTRDLVERIGPVFDDMIPPCSGIMFGNDVVSEAHEWWGATGEWEGSLTIYHDGSGDLDVVSPRGDLAHWHHGAATMENSDSFTKTAPNLRAFLLRYVRQLKKRHAGKKK